MKIIYFGYDLFAPCLKELLLMKNVEILKVYSFSTDNEFDFNCKVKSLADDNGIPFTIERITAEETAEQFNKNGCELAFSAGYLYRIPVSACESFRGINVHPALLPQGRGPWPFPWVILKGLSKSGVTVHKLAESLDTGDILEKKEFIVSRDETYDSLVLKSKHAAKELTVKVMNRFDFLWENATKQIGGEYWGEPAPEDRTVYIGDPPDLRDRIERAFGKKYVIYSDKRRK